jgi:hypothetical protein
VVADKRSIGGSPPSVTATVDWDSFDSKDYFEHNYQQLRRDDEQIIHIVADFFAQCAVSADRTPANGVEPVRAIDVGTGTNLYPALAMLPLAGHVTLCEHARTNRRWLEQQLSQPAASWRQFWRVMSAGRPAYAKVREPFEELRERTTVVEGDIFRLDPAAYAVGTMFFVAESITDRRDEFEAAVLSFVRSLVPRAPFAAAFMRDSVGFEVGDQEFPSCPIEELDVSQCLEPIAHDVTVHSVESRNLRSGYDGMIVATGRAGRL